MAKGVPIQWLPEEEAYILQNYKTKLKKEIAAEINQLYGTNRTAKDIKSYFMKKKLNSGMTGYFQKGVPSYNKGKKMAPETKEKVLKTCFKKGSRPWNAVPVGTEALQWKRNGKQYLAVKIAEPNVWKMKHHIEWEKYHPPVPKGMKLIFIDGDYRNCSIDNLRMVSESDLLQKNRFFPEAKNEILNVAYDIIQIQGKVKRRNEND